VRCIVVVVAPAWHGGVSSWILWRGMHDSWCKYKGSQQSGIVFSV